MISRDGDGRNNGTIDKAVLVEALGQGIGGET
jgi:hypothetical protein